MVGRRYLGELVCWNRKEVCRFWVYEELNKYGRVGWICLGEFLKDDKIVE